MAINSNVKKIGITPNFKKISGITALYNSLYFKTSRSIMAKIFCPKIHYIALEVGRCADKENNAWSPTAAGKFLRFIYKTNWFKNILFAGLQNIQSGTQEGELVKTMGEVIPRVRVDKPWGWEIILATVREKIGDAEEGYTEKYLIVAGPLSNQRHEPYSEGGKTHAAKVETQTSYGPSPYLLRIGANTENEELYEIEPGGIFHIADNVWHQPSVRPGDIAIVKETSKPNIGPGSTTRDPNGDPWKEFRSVGDR